jgi:hypothetical protein
MDRGKVRKVRERDGNIVRSVEIESRRRRNGGGVDTEARTIEPGWDAIGPVTSDDVFAARAGAFGALRSGQA